MNYNLQGEINVKCNAIEAIFQRWTTNHLLRFFDMLLFTVKYWFVLFNIYCTLHVVESKIPTRGAVIAFS